MSSSSKGQQLPCDPPDAHTRNGATPDGVAGASLPREERRLSETPNPAHAMPRRYAAATLLLVPLLATIAVGFASRSASVVSAAVANTPWWASKRSPLNVYVAKAAWGWTTALFLAALVLCAPARPPSATAGAALRYVLATLYWIALVRWFFGPSLFDRVFVHTGGSCHSLQPDVGSDVAPTPLPFASMQSCRSAGGSWAGGHDVSGHCFLLIHSALLLAEEALVPLWSAGQRVRHGRWPTVRGSARWAVLAATLALVGLWLFMLYVTASYFHHVNELLSGIVAGTGFWAALYYYYGVLR
ncbi:hypothetical protein H4R20_006898 [Coemansia guatemalensis]|uniref:Uncharacterized protein n=1 Tax=Coemansia guatemalensis TaxID=2761395 RepID=A0A9W8HTU8_9FUNG|nr:hypothetical protein H4R20_006898 [Coemansia guatemalensis]